MSTGTPKQAPKPENLLRHGEQLDLLMSVASLLGFSIEVMGHDAYQVSRIGSSTGIVSVGDLPAIATFLRGVIAGKQSR